MCATSFRRASTSTQFLTVATNSRVVISCQECDIFAPRLGRRFSHMVPPRYDEMVRLETVADSRVPNQRGAGIVYVLGRIVRTTSPNYVQNRKLCVNKIREQNYCGLAIHEFSIQGCGFLSSFLMGSNLHITFPVKNVVL